MDTTRLVVYTLLAAGAVSTVVYLRRVARTGHPEEVPAMFRPSPTPVAPAATRAKDESRVPAIDRSHAAQLETATFAFG